MINHIFCDLDGTLLYHTVPQESNHLIIDKNIKALQRLEKHGITFSIATGRHDKDIKMIQQIIKQQGYRISDNGAIVITPNEERLINLEFDFKQQKEVLNATLEKDLIVFMGDLKQNKGYFSKNTTAQYRIDLMQKMNLNWEAVVDQTVEDVINKQDMEVNHVCIILDPSVDNGAKIQGDLQAKLGEDFNVFWSASTSIDITLKDADKGQAIKAILKHENLTSDEIAVIGDGFNDVGMFNQTVNSFVMSHASNKVKAKATYEVSSVAEAIHKIIEMNEG